MRKPAAEKFPLVVKQGHAVAKVYRTDNRGRVAYTVAWVDPTRGRQRRMFTSLDTAKREAGNVVHHLALGDLEALKLTGQEKQVYVAASKAVGPTGLALDAAAREFAEAWAVLGGRAGVIEAARHYVACVGADLPKIAVGDAVERFRRAKDAEGISPHYRKDLRLILGRLADHFRCLLRDVAPEDLRLYLAAVPGSAIAKNNHRRVIVAFFNFARAQGWLRTPTAAADLPTFKVTEKDVTIYTPDEVAALLAHADPDFRPWLVFMAFGGTRREELHKGLAWEHYDFDAGRLTVPAAVSKVNRKRKVDLADNARAWLAPYRGRTGPVFGTEPDWWIEKTSGAAGVPWKHNGLRHSFGSYRMEQVKNAGQVALEMGNSPAVILRHYHELVSAGACAAYWSIRPVALG